MDDIWSVEVWDKVQLFFPDNGQGSRVMITTRLSNIVFQLIGSHGLVMDLLDVDKSWDLLYGSIFGKEEDCPVELEEIGKKIAKNCKGLPLSIVVIGGLLAKGKSLEVVSREYLKDLCDRNLIRAHQRGTNGGIKFCTIHDLVRELCLREAEKEKFLYVRRQHDLNNPQGIINTQRRICIHHSTTQKKYLPAALHALQYVPLARSLFFKFEGVLPSLDHCRLLRILRAVDTYLNFDGQNIHCMYTLEDVFQLVNSWYLAVEDFRDENLCKFPSSVYLLWNLQALIVESLVGVVVAPSEIWKMTQLRHVQFSSGLEMHDPPLGRQDDEFVLGNLQTLSLILNFKCGEEVRNSNPLPATLIAGVSQTGMICCRISSSPIPSRS
ncbi:PREDICTED: putative late blight resistance protein homolog R1A-3 [Erythranthe guttata]|uniref:putative late blight resistance protein homolog R1A-3 n=1 Tax=Erythranthe guttata TaxID=4155 RepID=UPI00064DFB8B|nr:PREDICTED: putative late blight resistance protein homolog R1A-3 [Erythranthe guttata]|eukprot:XP_012853776.1 PREDICTED: putative late blight resistance protein homolog R1A-3 [Erythranthe guttata]